MTINILFLSITIKKRTLSLQEACHQEEVEKLYDKNRDQQISMHRFFR
ncbi:YrzI family small protein [Neobacillus drentensis]|jgi:uncharacterized protein (TIGR02413 family)|nr:MULTISPECIES: YrzI family small protein [Bacillaceae]MDR6123655.1 uncharacterized protein (TIGR02413 family) [Bacillus sp. SLBN-46]WML56201.1 YrzI family small protein [Neobacillus sp. PS2-9]